MSTLSTHILDISTGRPAQGVKIALEREGALVARGVTDDNGRIGELGAGRWRRGVTGCARKSASGLPPAGARRST
jgi:5-hydroxyisourate hydrolase